MRFVLAALGVALGFPFAWGVGYAAGRLYAPYAPEPPSLDAFAAYSFLIALLVFCTFFGWLGWRWGKSARG